LTRYDSPTTKTVTTICGETVLRTVYHVSGSTLAQYASISLAADEYFVLADLNADREPRYKIPTRYILRTRPTDDAAVELAASMRVMYYDEVDDMIKYVRVE